MFTSRLSAVRHRYEQEGRVMSDFDLFSTPEEPVPEKVKPSNDRRNKVIIGAVAAVVATVGVFAFSGNGDDGEPVATSAAPEPVAVDVPLVNAEQRDFAGLVCNGSTFWNGKMVPVQSSDGTVSPAKARDALANALKKNSETAAKYAKSVSGYPERALKSASSGQEIPSVTVLEKKVGDEPDGKVSDTSDKLSSAITSFSNDMSGFVDALRKPASYDDSGLRSAISDASSSMSSSRNTLGDELSKILTPDIFDNVTTLKAGTDKPACSGGIFADKEQLDSLAGDINRESVIRKSVIESKCSEFIKTADSAIGDDGKLVADKKSSKEDKAKVAVFNSDIGKCRSVVADPGYDRNDPIVKDGVKPVPDDAVRNELPSQVEVAQQTTDAPSSAASTTEPQSASSQSAEPAPNNGGEQ